MSAKEHNLPPTPRILIIAGSDSGGGAGIQADIKTVTMLGGHAMTAITAITAQNTRGVTAVHPVPTEMVIAQIDAVVSDIGVDAVKIGMIGSAETAHAVADRLKALDVPIVFDPVMVATSGASLVDADTIAAFETLMARATLVTPNIPELEALSGIRVTDGTSLREAARGLIGKGRAGAVLAKGGHLPEDFEPYEPSGVKPATYPSGQVYDTLYMPFWEACWSGARIETRHTHGTGCTLASAIAVGLATGLSMPAAVLEARAFVRGALVAAPGFGAGHGPMGHWAALDGRMNLNQVTLPARDYGEAVDFYRRLGLTQIVNSPTNSYARFECPGGATLSIHVEPEPRAGDAVIYLESADLDAWTKELWRTGIRMDGQAGSSNWGWRAPELQSWGWREARLTDPTGNRLCLYHAGAMRRFPPWRVG